MLHFCCLSGQGTLCVAWTVCCRASWHVTTQSLWGKAGNAWHWGCSPASGHLAIQPLSAQPGWPAQTLFYGQQRPLVSQYWESLSRVVQQNKSFQINEKLACNLMCLKHLLLLWVIKPLTKLYWIISKHKTSLVHESWHFGNKWFSQDHKCALNHRALWLHAHFLYF